MRRLAKVLALLLFAVAPGGAWAQVSAGEDALPTAPPSDAVVTFVVQGSGTLRPEAAVPTLDVPVIVRAFEDPHLAALEAQNTETGARLTLRFRFDRMQAFSAWYASDATQALLRALDEAVGVQAVTLDVERRAVP